MIAFSVGEYPERTGRWRPIDVTRHESAPERRSLLLRNCSTLRDRIFGLSSLPPVSRLELKIRQHVISVVLRPGLWHGCEWCAKSQSLLLDWHSNRQAAAPSEVPRAPLRQRDRYEQRGEILVHLMDGVDPEVLLTAE